MTVTGRRPLSHPVLRRLAVRDQLLDAMREPGGVLGSPSEIADQTARIEDLARRVVLLDGPLNGQQRRSLHLIASELLRRAEA